MRLLWICAERPQTHGVWQCNSTFECGCTTPHLEENDIRERVIQVVNRLLRDKDNVIASAKKQKQTFLTEQFIHDPTVQTEPLTEWKESTFKMIVESITVMPDGRLLFRLRDGTVAESSM